MPAVTADDDQICADLASQRMYFRFWPAKDQMLVIRRNIQFGGEFREVALRSHLNLLLYGGQVHRDIATVGEAQWFDDMETAEPGTISAGQCACAMHAPGALACPWLDSSVRSTPTRICLYSPIARSSIRIQLLLLLTNVRANVHRSFCTHNRNRRRSYSSDK